MSEYDPLISHREHSGVDDLEQVQRHFEAASKPYLASPVPWLVWALVLPMTAVATPTVASRWAEAGVLFVWSLAVLVGGAVEVGFMRRRRDRRTTPLGGWVMRLQGNQSLVGLLLSLFLFWQGLAFALPAVWLLLIGHSFLHLGGLAFRAMRRAGVVYQIGGAIALWPTVPALVVFAATTALGNALIAMALWRERR